MPVIAAIKCGCEFTRRRNIGVAVKHMTDLIRIFLLDARQRQLRESLCGMNLELWSNAVSSDADQWSQEESEEKKSRHRARILRLRSTGCQPVNVSPTRTFALVAETFRAWVGLPAAAAFVRRVSQLRSITSRAQVTFSICIILSLSPGCSASLQFYPPCK